MTIHIFNPVGEIAPLAATATTRLGPLHGRRAGLVFNQHPACIELWRELERSIERTLAPAAIRRMLKANLSVPQKREDLAALARDTDYVLVGVGA